MTVENVPVYRYFLTVESVGLPADSLPALLVGAASRLHDISLFHQKVEHSWYN